MSDTAAAQVTEAVIAALTTRVDAQRAAALAEDLDAARFLTDDDQVDATKVDAFVARVAPATATRFEQGRQAAQRRFPATGGQGRSDPGPAVKRMDAGRDEARRRFGPRGDDAA